MNIDNLQKFFVIFILVNCIHGVTFSAPSTFEEMISKKYQSSVPDHDIDTEILTSLKDKHLFFVPGFMNELLIWTGSYFRTNIEILSSNHGLSVSKHVPSSMVSIFENSELLFKEIMQSYNKHKKPFILIGHSKGGAEILYMILRYPKLLLEGIIEKVVLVQAAIGGSPLAEGSRWELPLQLISLLTRTGLHSLTPGEASKRFLSAYHEMKMSLVADGVVSQENLDSSLKQIKDKIFYIRSQDDHINLGPGISFALYYLGKDLRSHGASDGFVLVEDQIFAPEDEVFGTDLGILSCDHLGLIESMFGNRSYRWQTSFTTTLLERIYQGEKLLREEKKSISP